MYNTDYEKQLIQAGKNKIKDLQKNHYLHNSKRHYEDISDFEPIDIKIMDTIMYRIVQKQKKREKRFLQLLNFNNVKELNDFFNSKINLNLVDSKIEDILQKASENIDINGNGAKTKKQIENEATKIIDNLINEQFQDNNIIQALQDSLGKQVAYYFKKTTKSKNNTDKFIEDLGKSWGNEWRKSVLEESITAIINSLLKDLGKTNSKITTSGKDTRTSGKIGIAVKADNTIEDFETGMTFGISAKNYSFLKSSSGEVTLHSKENLENFYNLIENSTSTDKIDTREMKNLVKKFKKNDFIYHLINSAAHQGGKTNRYGGKSLMSSPADNLISFVKKCLPLFIGTQLKIEGNETNVDFLNVGGTFVPVSTILENVFFTERKKRGNLFGNRINLYSNYTVNWDKMLSEKKNNNSKNFYSQETQKVGGYYGNEVYKNMRLGRMHLRIALSKLK